MKVDAAGGLLVGGAFTTANAVTVNGIARWNGTTFTAYGTGVAGGTATVYDVLIAGNGYIYICGDFTSADGDTACNSMAFWSGADWDPMVTGTASICRALAEDPAGNIYIGGEFLDLGDADGDYIVMWSGMAFTSLSVGLNGICYALDWGEDGLLYLGGAFTTAGGVTANRVAGWDGSGFFALGTGADSNVYKLKYHDGIVYIGGFFTGLSARTATGFGVWNGSTFEPMPIILPGTPIVKAIEISKWGDVYLGFNTTGTATLSDQSAFITYGTERIYPVLQIVNSHATDVTVLRYLENYTTGVEVWFTYSIKPSETVIIDFHPARFSVISSLYGNISRIIDEGSNTNFYLLPGYNSISFLGYGGTPTANFIYRPVHAMADGAAA
jgi:hypothetical protein